MNESAKLSATFVSNVTNPLMISNEHSSLMYSTKRSGVSNTSKSKSRKRKGLEVCSRNISPARQKIFSSNSPIQQKPFPIFTDQFQNELITFKMIQSNKEIAPFFNITQSQIFGQRETYNAPQTETESKTNILLSRNIEVRRKEIEEKRLQRIQLLEKENKALKKIIKKEQAEKQKELSR